ncbi:MAG: hypothetical protein ACYTGH_20800, partial [Planctomycetota bacterium]
NVLNTAASQLAAMKAAAAASIEEGQVSKQEREGLMKALKELAKAMGGMEELSPELKKALAKALKGLPKNGGQGGLTPSALNGLDAKALQKLAQSLMKNCKSGMEGAGQCQGLLSPSAAQALKQMMAGLGKLSQFDPTQMGLAKGMMPGKGGVNRGRGDAPLQFGDESDPDGARFNPLLKKPNDKFLPGVKIASTRMRVKKIAPKEFQIPARTGIELKGAVTQVGTTELSPARRTAAAAYFNKLSAGE